MKFNFSTLNSLIIFVVIIAFFGCGNNPLDVDVSGISIELEVKRFDQDLFTLKDEVSDENIKKLTTKYNVFLDGFTSNIINVGPINSEEAKHHLGAFVNDAYILEIKNKIKTKYEDFSVYQQDLTEAFRHYKYYFPNRNVPEIITYISGYNYAIVTDDTYLGIGLDMFLGNNHEAYSRLGLPQYKTNFMGPENLVPGAVLGWVSTEFDSPNTNADLLTEMVHQGKILYITDALMPKTPNTLKINYTAEQLNWCKANSEGVWFFLIDNELLYSKTTSEIIKFMGEAPFIQGFPEGSPGRIGHWVGWQIVKAYMDKHPDTKLEKLMQMNAQELLNKSKYKP